MSLYEYSATVLDVHDGDTVTLSVDLGFDIHKTDHFRLDGIDAPELNTDAGKAARDYLKTLAPPGSPIKLHTVKDRKEKYGRYLAVLTTSSGVVVNDDMIFRGYAKSYAGGARTV